MKIDKNKVKLQTILVNPIIYLKRLPEKVAWKGRLKRCSKQKYIAIKCHNTPGDCDGRSYEINLPYFGGGSPEEWLVWKDKVLKTLDDQSISMAPQRYTFIERLLTGDAKATFNQVALDIGIRTFGNDQRCICSICFLRKTHYLQRHQVKPRSMKLHSFVTRTERQFRGISSWSISTRNWIPFHRWNHGYYLTYHAHHVEKQDDLTNIKLWKFCLHKSDWFFWD